MVNKRNRLLNLIEYLKSLNIEVNYNKNKARGNKGFFKTNANFYRIDIAKGLTENEQLKVLLHEFGHFIHYQADNNLKDLNSFFEQYNDGILDELIELTVYSIDKKDISNLIEKQSEIKQEIKELTHSIKEVYPLFKPTKTNKEIETQITKKGFGCLLKYDKVKIIDLFKTKYYDINEIDKYFSENDIVLTKYLKIKSKIRHLKRINTKISKLNKYYNLPTELFARAFELYFTNKLIVKSKAPNVYNNFNKNLTYNKYFNICNDILTKEE